MLESDLTYKIAISAIKGMTPAVIEQVMQRVGSLQAFFELPDRQLEMLMGQPMRWIDSNTRSNALATARREQLFIDDKNINAIYCFDPDFPQLLLQCPDSPVMLYTLGKCHLNNLHILSIVGTRHCTPYGANFIHSLVEELGRRVKSLAIVSGLAYGVDVAAHKESLRANIPTVGVLAHGLTTIYPSSHRNVAVDIVNHGGMLLTEYRADTPVHKGNFLSRNRIVAGMSDAVLVVESATKGGALVTARLANDYNREVMAVPGRTTDIYSQGCNCLIATHQANLVNNADDVINLLGWQALPDTDSQTTMQLDLTPDQAKVIESLANGQTPTINQISIDTGIPIAKLMPLLVDMDFSGLIRSIPGGRYMAL